MKKIIIIFFLSLFPYNSFSKTSAKCIELCNKSFSKLACSECAKCNNPEIMEKYRQTNTKLPDCDYMCPACDKTLINYQNCLNKCNAKI